ncbi:MAG: signal peptidase I [Patescibacteria group bacterium]
MDETKTSTPNSSLHKEPTLLSELIRFALITLFIVVPIRVFIAQPFIVSGSSMDPTFENGEYLIVDEITYRLDEPKRGDVIIFKYPQDTSKFFIKRIIGLPDETVLVEGSKITITNKSRPEGLTLDEAYLIHPTHSNIRITLADDEYFVMGDNRPASSDSRIWGALPRNLIVGRAFVRLLPLGKIDAFPGVHRYEDIEAETASTTEEN